MNLSFILALLFICEQGLALHWACRDVWFGKPAEEDALKAIKQFPDYGLRTNRRMSQHLFVQPQYLDPPFSPVTNRHTEDMVQLPKIWRSGESNSP